jgi:phage-related protein
LDAELLTKRTNAYNDILDDLKRRQNEANKEASILSKTMDDVRKAFDDNTISGEEARDSMRNLNNAMGEQLNIAADLDDEINDVKDSWKKGTLNLKGFETEVTKTNTSFTKFISSLKGAGVFLSRVFVVISAITAVIPFAIGLVKGIGEALDNAFAGKNETINQLFGPLNNFGRVLNTVLSEALNVDDAFKNFWKSITEIYEGLDDISEGFFMFFEGIGTALGRFIIDPLKEIKALWDAIIYAQGQSEGRGGQDRFGGINAPSPAPTTSRSIVPGLTVNVSALAPSPEIGRQVVAAISDYERTSGRRFA